MKIIKKILIFLIIVALILVGGYFGLKQVQNPTAQSIVTKIDELLGRLPDKNVNEEVGKVKKGLENSNNNEDNGILQEDITYKEEPQQPKQTAASVNEEINYAIAERLANAHGIEFNDGILADYVKSLVENTEKQTPDDIGTNIKSVIAMVGYESYGKALAMDYVINRIVETSSDVTDEDRNNEEKINKLKEEYSEDPGVKKIQNEKEKVEYLLKKDSEMVTKRYIDKEISNFSKEIYNELLKKYNPTYYNSVMKGSPIGISYETPKTDLEGYKNQIGLNDSNEKDKPKENNPELDNKSPSNENEIKENKDNNN